MTKCVCYLILGCLTWAVCGQNHSRLRRTDVLKQILDRQARRDAEDDAEDRSCPTKDRVSLLRCLTDKLDDWALNIERVRDSLEHLDCAPHKEMEECLTAAKTCSEEQAIRISETLTDLLLYNKDSGTFLLSFFALDYACSSDGQDIVNKNKLCLKQNNEGFYMLAAVDEVQDKFAQFKKDRLQGVESAINPCQLLYDIARREWDEVERLCGPSPQVAMFACRTVTDAFLKIAPEHFGQDKCGLTYCPTQAETTTAPEEATPEEGIDVAKDSSTASPDEEVQAATAESPQQQNGDATKAGAICTASFTVFLSACVASWLMRRNLLSMCGCM